MFTWGNEGVSAAERRKAPSALRRTVIVAAVAVGALAGCAPVRWEKPGADAATMQADTRECRAIARRQHRDLTRQPLLVPYFVTTGDNKGRVRPVVPWTQFGPPVWMPYAPSLAIDQRTLRHKLYEDCMEAKGYQLVPDEDQPTPSDEDPPASLGDCRLPGCGALAQNRP